MKTKQVLFTLSMIMSSVCSVAQWTDQNSTITNDLEDVHFVDANNGWAVGRQGKIVKTSNGGSTWTTQNSGTTNDLNDVFMVSTSVGYAVGDGGKVIKYNGSSWSTIDISYSQDMFGVYFLDASTGWISGDWGRIMMTTDGGASWITQVNNSMYSNSFHDLHMLDAGDGWAVGSTGRILHYDGTNWINIPSGTTEDLNSVSFSNASNGFIGGESSTMLYCDGSSISTYGTDLPDNSYHIYDVVTISNSLAYAATSAGFGGQGIILKYNGSTWAVDYEYTGMNTELFTGIDFPTSTKGYAVANSGIIKSKGSAPAGIFDEEEQVLTTHVYPNPFTGQIAIATLVEEGGILSVALCDVSGKVIYIVADQQLAPGAFKTHFDGTALEPGVYFVQVISGTKTETVKVIKQ
jgi:photosystem II stability/assembly factor-like uncharacterized protein